MLEMLAPRRRFPEGEVRRQKHEWAIAWSWRGGGLMVAKRVGAGQPGRQPRGQTSSLRAPTQVAIKAQHLRDKYKKKKLRRHRSSAETVTELPGGESGETVDIFVPGVAFNKRFTARKSGDQNG